MGSTQKERNRANWIAEREQIKAQLTALRAERKILKRSEKPYGEIDDQIRKLVKRSGRIDSKLNPKPEEGGGYPIKLTSKGSPSAPKYKTYHAASLRPVQGGKTSPK